ncbi:MAG: undecaprenyl-diphosphate phosphatase [Lachnospiraceae bacterium]|nr:undecaprenyl-diphosphate phosphatase [Lachnospiraceae bacterium]MCI9283405.1 undecaprenyl-diphosphate phosphatase [Lachnospiraceae bacterium]
MNIIEFLKIVVFGIVEGFTEWLPISSTGHMILLEELIPLRVTDDFWNVFKVVIQLGAILAVVMLYFHKLNPFDRGKSGRQKRDTILLWLKIAAACVPVVVVAMPLDDWMDAHLYNGFVVAAMLIVYGVLFLIIENRNHQMEFPIQRVSQIDLRTAVYIGCFQLLALVPGTSRSGVTIIGAMLLGCSRAASAEFTFFLGIPVMFGASLLKIVKFFLKADRMFSGTEIFYLIAAMIIAYLVSVYSIKFLMGYIKRNDFKLFGYYRIILGVIVVAYFTVAALMA